MKGRPFPAKEVLEEGTYDAAVLLPAKPGAEV
jgi:hypothetical protein